MTLDIQGYALAARQLFDMQQEPGWEGYFTRQQSPMAAYPNGARVVDARRMVGSVLGSVGAPGFGVGYFVEFDKQPRIPAFVMQGKLVRIS